MNYEKAYKDRLERAKSFVERGGEYDRQVMESIFPELKESEDERQKEQKPINMEVYEAGKGTTICGQDYKCKKGYRDGNCWYIKDVIYHCGRDGYLTDQNGISWSCTPGWFKEYIYSNAEWAEKEKSEFVSGQFIQCNCTLDNGLKEGAHYWLEYIGGDTYVGRSDNILNQKFHITPRQLFTLFSQELEEKQKERKDYRKLYEDIAKSEWFKKAYEGKSLGCDEEQKEQKPAEWSDEEDKTNLKDLHKFLFSLGDLPHTTYVRLDSWLKSLRPQPKEDLNAIVQREYARGKQDGYWEGVKAERESCKTFHYESPNWPPKMPDLPTETTTNEGVSSIQPHWKPSEDEEKLIKTSISFLKDFADKGYENAVECIDWLKSKLNGTSTNAK